MGLAREKNVKLSYTGKRVKVKTDQGDRERIPIVLPFLESLKLSLGYAFFQTTYHRLTRDETRAEIDVIAA